MITVALYNLKGGVGKTASCVNFAYLAAGDGFKTLLWDIDPQGSTTYYYKIKPKDIQGIKKLLSKDANVEAAIMSTNYENLEIIPADASAKSFDILLEEMRGNKNRIKGMLKQFGNDYDFVFIDCPPGLNALSENIFQASDVVLMPIIPTTLSVRTYNMVKDYFKEKDLDSSKLMCFFTLVDLRKNMHNEVMDQLFKDKKFFQNYIPYLSDVEKMGIFRQPIEEFARSSYAARCYHELWTEIKEGVVE